MPYCDVYCIREYITIGLLHLGIYYHRWLLKKMTWFLNSVITLNSVQLSSVIKRACLAIHLPLKA